LQHQRSVDIWPKSWEWSAMTCIGCHIRWLSLKTWSVSNWHNACSRR
jgi:hypothetical protein